MLRIYVSRYFKLFLNEMIPPENLSSPLSPLQQLRANIREMEKLCARVRAEDASALEALVQPVRDRASAAAQDFLQLHSSPVSQPPSPTAPQPTSTASGSSHSDDDAEEELVSGRQTQLHLPEIPADESAAESWDNLEEVRMSDPSLYVILVTEALWLSSVTVYRP